MENKIFLEAMRSKQSRNTSPGMHVELKGNSRLLPIDGVSNVISQMEQYTEEREKCRKIRLTCQVNPVCTNILFNRISEIVKHEGSSGVTMLNYGISGDTNPFLNEQVSYKPYNIEFWSGGNMSYQAIDEVISRLAAGTQLKNVERTTINGNSKVIQTEVHPTNAIRDTQLSKNDTNGDHFVYHCGLDILNNHLIRSNTFKCICKMPDTQEWNRRMSGWTWDEREDYTAFNTIADLMREAGGNKVVEKVYFPVSSGVDGGAKLVGLHMYLSDDILSYKDSVKKRLIDKYNGWLGFLNKSKIKSYQDFVNNTDMKMERPIMYMNGGDYVDMYPGRDLYSFVPKYNEYRNRMEKNWNYCITYPSTSTIEGFDDIIEPSNDSMKSIYFDENTIADSGARQLVIYSRAKHGLSAGDRVNIYKNYETTVYYVIDGDGNRVSEEFEDKLDAEASKAVLEAVTSLEGLDIVSANTTANHVAVYNAKVDEVVDDYIFTTFTQDSQISDTWIELELGDYLSGFTTSAYNESTSSYVITHYSASTDGSRYFYDDDLNKYYVVNDKYINVDKKAQNITYKKTVGEIECDYYVRLFSRLPNFRFASGDTSTEYSVYNKPEDGDSMLSIYQSPEFEFESHVSRLAFAKNIYSDDIGEIVFTDDINFDNLKDNLGRPLTDVYLTVVKANAGYKEWYGFDGMPITVSADTIEFSHCFGKVTCGLEMSDESIIDKTANNIKLINNLEGLNVGYSVGDINQDRYSSANSADTIARCIMPQEIDFSHDKHFYGDLCYYDNYNAVERTIQPILHRFNTAQRESSMAASKDYFSTLVYDEITRDDYDTGDDFIIKQYRMDDCNYKPEGYYYEPHYKIPIRSFGALKTMMPQFLSMQSLVNRGGYTQITTQQYHFLTAGDKAMIYDMVKDKYYRLTTVPGDGDSPRIFSCKITTEKGKPTMEVDGNKLSNYKLFKLDNMEAPSYAHLLKDGTCRYIWRNVVNNGSPGGDRDLEEYPFTNGAFYVNRKIDIYLRRQDPYDNYGLYSEDDIDMIGIEPDVEEINNYHNEEEIEC